MSRQQKKCLFFSVGLHGLLAVILLASAGFGSSPPKMDLQVMTLIPANIVDRAAAVGGSAILNPAPQSKPQAQTAAPSKPQPQTVQAERVERVKVAPPPRHKETKPLPEPEDAKEMALELKPKPSKPSPRHPIRVSYTLANAATTPRKSEHNSSSETASSARAEARRLKEIENSLAELASGVRSSGSPSTIVDVEGIGGETTFAGYKDLVYSAYYRAWIAPADTASRLASVDAKVTIARNGSIISAELVRSSDDPVLDKSVERALREVTKLPPFPASTRDAERTFVIRFNLDGKELAG